ncbi:hypothetical protein NKH77_40420 [Streptomyces sp. M19]
MDRFRAKGVAYSRTYREGMGLTWQEAYQTEDRREVEKYCAEHGIDVTWTDEGLRTRQRGPALVTHPRGGEESWFNQAHLFHTSNLPTGVREALAEMYAEEDMPGPRTTATDRPSRTRRWTRSAPPTRSARTPSLAARRSADGQQPARLARPQALHRHPPHPGGDGGQGLHGPHRDGAAVFGV